MVKKKKISADKTSPATFNKLKEYPEILRTHLNALRIKTYSLLELNAGCGFDDIKVKQGKKERVERSFGTPILAIAVLRQYKEVATELIAVDNDKKACQLLYETAINYAADYPIKQYNRNHSDPTFIDALPNTSEAGLIFFDPYGAPENDTIQRYASRFPRFDLLIRLNLSQCYRDIGSKVAGRNSYNAFAISKIIVSNSCYKYWLISKPIYVRQWCWLFGTNDLRMYEQMKTARPVAYESKAEKQLFCPIFYSDEDKKWLNGWDNKNITTVLNTNITNYNTNKIMSNELELYRNNPAVQAALKQARAENEANLAADLEKVQMLSEIRDALKRVASLNPAYIRMFDVRICKINDRIQQHLNIAGESTPEDIYKAVGMPGEGETVETVRQTLEHLSDRNPECLRRCFRSVQKGNVMLYANA